MPEATPVNTPHPVREEEVEAAKGRVSETVASSHNTFGLHYGL